MAANLQFVGFNRISYIKQLITGGTQPCRDLQSQSPFGSNLLLQCQLLICSREHAQMAASSCAPCIFQGFRQHVGPGWRGARVRDLHGEQQEFASM